MSTDKQTTGLSTLPEDMLNQRAFLILSPLQSGTENVVRLDVAFAALAAERERWMALACDGWSVLQGLDERAQRRTSHQNVSDVLDAFVRVMRGQS